MTKVKRKPDEELIHIAIEDTPENTTTLTWLTEHCSPICVLRSNDSSSQEGAFIALQSDVGKRLFFVYEEGDSYVFLRKEVEYFLLYHNGNDDVWFDRYERDHFCQSVSEDFPAFDWNAQHVDCPYKSQDEFLHQFMTRFFPEYPFSKHLESTELQRTNVQAWFKQQFPTRPAGMFLWNPFTEWLEQYIHEHGYYQNNARLKPGKKHHHEIPYFHFDTILQHCKKKMWEMCNAPGIPLCD